MGMSKNAWIGIGLVGSFVLIAIIGRLTVGTGADTARPGVGDVIVDTTTTAAEALPPLATSSAPAIACLEAPSVIVDLINASFTNGEHLANAQSVNAPKATTFVGGDIVNGDGSRVSSRDSWLVSNGVTYAITSDARRRTLLPDGRDVVFDWMTYNDALGNCVGRVDAATPG